MQPWINYKKLSRVNLLDGKLKSIISFGVDDLLILVSRFGNSLCTHSFFAGNNSFETFVTFVEVLSVINVDSGFFNKLENNFETLSVGENKRILIRW